MHDPVLTQARGHMEARRPEQAVQILRKALEKTPGELGYLQAICEILSGLGREDQAVYLLERAIAASPREAWLYRKCADLHTRKGRHAEAERQYRRAAELSPPDMGLFASVANAMLLRGDADGARSFVRAVYEAHPGDPRALQLYAGHLEMLGDLEGAVALLSGVLERSPNDTTALRMLMIPLMRVRGVEPERIFELHRRLGSLMTEQVRPLAGSHTNSPDPERRLRIGYCSQDFRNRSVGHFIEPILEHHDRERFEVVLYHDMMTEDELTERLKKSAALYVQTQRLSQAEFVAMVRRQGIDILVDLSGHSGSRHTLSMAAKPAPVQFTYLGYPNTTGIPAIDYRIVDAITDPPGAERLATEKLVRIEGGFLCYRLPGHAGPVAPAPCEKRGSITFGSFNTITKVGKRVLEVWARILGEVPDSRLLLKARGLSSQAARERLIANLQGAGVSRSRIELREETPDPGAHLAMYSEIDVALDTWPYNGTTTTVEALAMGVAVVSIAGETHASRVGMSLLSAVGLSDLCAADEDQYVRVAVDLARDAPRRKQLRESLRPMLLASPLCDEAGFAGRLESVYRDAWRAWCAGRRAG
ncbi:MAG: tetratricopeptide repeat protein [Phycisphaerales bacterium]|nr:tetratricopeptide repeat protein [Planctomycetota bacterium]